MAQNALGQSDYMIFQSITGLLNLAVSHKELNEVNWFLVCQSNNFLRNGSLDCSNFGTMIDNSNIEKLTEPFFPIFGVHLGKRAQNGRKIGFLGFFEKFCQVGFSWK